MEDILEVVTLNRLFGVKQLKEVLDELRGDVHLELAHFDGFMDHQLQKEFVDSLEMGPRGVHLFFLVHTGFRHAQVALLDVGKRSEDVLLNHVEHFIQMGNDQSGDCFLVLQHTLQLLDRIKTISLKEVLASWGFLPWP